MGGQIGQRVDEVGRCSRSEASGGWDGDGELERGRGTSR